MSKQLNAEITVGEVQGTQWKTVGTLLWPCGDPSIKPARVWCAVAAGDSSGVELVIEDVSGSIGAGPAVTFGAVQYQTFVVSPLRQSAFSGRGSWKVMLVRARNRTDSAPPSRIGQVIVELQ